MTQSNCLRISDIMSFNKSRIYHTYVIVKFSTKRERNLLVFFLIGCHSLQDNLITFIVILRNNMITNSLDVIKVPSIESMA